MIRRFLVFLSVTLLASQVGAVEILKHRSVGPSISQAEYESDTSIYFSNGTNGSVPYYNSSTGYFQGLPIGATGSMLTSINGLPSWSDPSTFVPFTGAEDDLNLGSNNLLASRIISDSIVDVSDSASIYSQNFETESQVGTTLIDGSQYYNQATMYGNPLFSTNSYNNSRCIKFDGVDDYIHVTSDPKMNNTGIHSLSVWVKIDAYPTEQKMIVGKGTGLSSGNGWALFLSPATVQYYLFDGTSPSPLYQVSNSMLTFDVWHLITVVKSTSGNTETGCLNIYIDGLLVPGTGTDYGTNTLPSIYSMSIGGRVNGSGYLYDDYLDDVRLYDRALTSNEIKAMYDSKIENKQVDNNSIDVNERNLSLAMSFDPSAVVSPTVLDSSNQINNGTLTNGPVVNSGGYVTFDGSNDYISIADPASDALDLAGAHTINLWIYITAYPSEAQCIIGKTNSASSGGGWELLFSPSTLRYVVFDGTSPSPTIDVSATDIPLSKWTMISVGKSSTGVVEEGDVKIFVNGQLGSSKVETNMGTATALNARPVTIGTIENGTLPFSGSIDNLSIWSRCLSDMEIKALYDVTQKVESPKLSLYSPFIQRVYSPVTFYGQIRATSYLDNTPGWEKTSEEALDSIIKIKSKVEGGKVVLDHDTLPAEAQKVVEEKINYKKIARIENKTSGTLVLDSPTSTTVIEDVETSEIESVVEIKGRDLGAMITILTESVKALEKQNRKLEKEIEKLKTKVDPTPVPTPTPTNEITSSEISK